MSHKCSLFPLNFYVLKWKLFSLTIRWVERMVVCIASLKFLFIFNSFEFVVQNGLVILDWLIKMALEKFCLCCKLRNGAVIWGCVCIIGSLITLIVTVSSDIFVDRVETEILDENGFKNIGNFHYDTLKTPFYWLILASSIVNVLLSILLVIGAVKVIFLKTVFFK